MESGRIHRHEARHTMAFASQSGWLRIQKRAKKIQIAFKRFFPVTKVKIILVLTGATLRCEVRVFSPAAALRTWRMLSRPMQCPVNDHES